MTSNKGKQCLAHLDAPGATQCAHESGHAGNHAANGLSWGEGETMWATAEPVNPDAGYSLWNPPPDWHTRRPFEGRGSLLDPSVTPEQIRAAMDSADERSAPFRCSFGVRVAVTEDGSIRRDRAQMSPESMHRPICGPSISRAEYCSQCPHCQALP